jgi:hypothetical protein
MQLRFAMMFSVTSLAGAFSGLLAYGIRNLDGKHGIAGWQWIFIVVRRLPLRSFSRISDHVTQEGAFTVAFGLATLFFVPDSPRNIRFLTDDERETYCRDLADDWSGDADADGTYQEVFSWSEVTSAFTNAPHVLMLFSPLFFNGTTVSCHSIVPSHTSTDESYVRLMVSLTCMPSRSLLRFQLTQLPRSTPTIVNSLGHSPNYTQLLTVRSFRPSMIAYILRMVTRYRRTPAPSFSASFLHISVINTRTAA